MKGETILVAIVSRGCVFAFGLAIALIGGSSGWLIGQ